MLNTQENRGLRVAGAHLRPSWRRPTVHLAGLLATTAILNACSSTGPRNGGVEMWVANYDANTLVGYSAAQINASTTAAPAVVIGTPPGGEGNPFGGNVAATFDHSGNLWIFDDETTPNTLVMYRSNQLLRSDTPAPAVTITAPSLVTPTLLAFDAKGNLWVACSTVNGSFDGALFEFTPAQLETSGQRVPAVTIGSNGTSLTVTKGIAFDRAGNLWVANSNFIDEFLANDLASTGSPTPAVVLTPPSPNSRTFEPYGLTFDPTGNLWVTSYYTSGLYELAASQLQTSGSPVPAVTLTAPGNTGGVIESIAVAFDRSGNLWVSSGTNTVSEFLPSQLKTSGSPSPAVSISGSALSLPSAVLFRQN